MKINLGCGDDIKEGYMNIDVLPESDKFNLDENTTYSQADVTNLLWLPVNDVEEIFARDVIEHIPIPRLRNALKTWHMVLRPGGKLIIQTPNLKRIAEEILNGKEEVGLSRIFANSVNIQDWHKSGFTPDILKEFLISLGFKTVKVFPNKDIYYPDYPFNMTAEAIK